MQTKISARALARSGQQRVPISSFSSAKNDSAAALSKHEPVRPMLCRIPNRRIPAEFVGGVLAAVVRVRDATGLEPAASGCHDQRIDD